LYNGCVYLRYTVNYLPKWLLLGGKYFWSTKMFDLSRLTGKIKYHIFNDDRGAVTAEYVVLIFGATLIAATIGLSFQSKVQDAISKIVFVGSSGSGASGSGGSSGNTGAGSGGSGDNSSGEDAGDDGADDDDDDEGDSGNKGKGKDKKHKKDKKD
jgi:uncharacterized membrane protein YgcG